MDDIVLVMWGCNLGKQLMLCWIELFKELGFNSFESFFFFWCVCCCRLMCDCKNNSKLLEFEYTLPLYIYVVFHKKLNWLIHTPYFRWSTMIRNEFRCGFLRIVIQWCCLTFWKLLQWQWMVLQNEIVHYNKKKLVDSHWWRNINGDSNSKQRGCYCKMLKVIQLSSDHNDG